MCVTLNRSKVQDTINAILIQYTPFYLPCQVFFFDSEKIVIVQTPAASKGRVAPYAYFTEIGMVLIEKKAVDKGTIICYSIVRRRWNGSKYEPGIRYCCDKGERRL